LLASFLAAILTEIYLGGVYSCQEISRRHGRGRARGAPSLGPGGSVYHAALP
jgi:hypothetical protein